MTTRDQRLLLLDQLLTQTGRDTGSMTALHHRALEQDGWFYGKLAVWYGNKGPDAEHGALFIAHLLTSPRTDQRDAGFAMLQDLEPAGVARVLGVMERDIGKVPRSTRTAVTRYLRVREADPVGFDQAVLGARKTMKRLYASLRIRPGARADAILFKNRPPEGSLVRAVKDLARETDTTAQVQLIRSHNIPYGIATSAVGKLSVEVALALLEPMGAQQLSPLLKDLQARGVLSDSRIRELVRSKLSEAGPRQIQSPGIGRDTALLVDGSERTALEVGKRLAACMAPAMDASLYTLVTGRRTRWATCRESGLAAWDQAFDSATACREKGSPLQVLIQRRLPIEQMVLVGDGWDGARLIEDIRNYSSRTGRTPRVILLAQSRGENLKAVLQEDGICCESQAFRGDYGVCSSLLPTLSGPSRLDLLSEILAVELPARAA